MARIREAYDLSELGSTAQLTAAGWTVGGAIDAATVYADILGNGGVYSMGADRDAFFLTPLLATPVVTFYSREHYRPTALNIRIMEWFSGGALMGDLRTNSSGNLFIRSGTTTLATSTLALVANNWYTIEVRWTVGDSATYEVRVDGVPWIGPSTGDTKPSTQTDIDQFRLGGLSFPDGVGRQYHDDFVVDDTDWVGESVITSLRPNGSGNYSQFTPSAVAAHYSLVDELPYNDADYISGLTNAERDSFLHTALPGAATVVKSVLLTARAARVGGTLNNMNHFVRIGGTDYDGSSRAVNPTATLTTEVYDESPATSSPWTVSEVNNAEVGVQALT